MLLHPRNDATMYLDFFGVGEYGWFYCMSYLFVSGTKWFIQLWSSLLERSKTPAEFVWNNVRFSRDGNSLVSFWKCVGKCVTYRAEIFVILSSLGRTFSSVLPDRSIGSAISLVVNHLSSIVICWKGSFFFLGGGTYVRSRTLIISHPS